MKLPFALVICTLCVDLTFSVKNNYKAAAIVHNDVDFSRSVSLIHEAAKSNADIVVLPPLQSLSDNAASGPDYYDEAVRKLSETAKQAGLYVVAHLYEKIRCQHKSELVRSNLVFDREGSIVSVYRKPFNNVANCTTSSSGVTTFTTDFGVTFGLLMEEDIVLQSVDALKNLKNFVVAGPWSSDISFLSASQFSSPWTFVTNANLVSSTGIYAGKAGAVKSDSKLILAELDKSGGTAPPSIPLVNSTKQRFLDEDLSQYIIRPLDLGASQQGYIETVCHGEFCCEFNIKTSLLGSSESTVSYGLAVFNGVRHFGRGHNIGLQSCAIFACAGLYKRSCTIKPENLTNFDKIIITGNFTKTSSAQYPIVVSTDTLANFKFDGSMIKNSKRVTIEAANSPGLLSFGIFGRDFSKDFESEIIDGKVNESGLTSDIYDYLYNEDVQEFFDYLWIRLRILIFVVSIYILEMM